jgi:hypothetical protein
VAFSRFNLIVDGGGVEVFPAGSLRVGPLTSTLRTLNVVGDPQVQDSKSYYTTEEFNEWLQQLRSLGYQVEIARFEHI